MDRFAKNHFVFDVDDTLTNSYEFNQQMFVETFKDILDLSNTEVDKFLRELHYRSRGTAMHLQFEEALKHFGLNQDQHDMVKKNEKMHVENIERIGTFEAVEDILKMFKENKKTISICTNRQYGSLKKILDKNNLTSYFTNVVSCIDEGHEKPDPYCLTQLIEKSGEPKDTFVYFGDSKTDHDFALNAGIDFVIIDQYMNQKKFFKMILQAFF